MPPTLAYKETPGHLVTVQIQIQEVCISVKLRWCCAGAAGAAGAGPQFEGEGLGGTFLFSSHDVLLSCCAIPIQA